LARFAWINPEALHESVMELELVLFGIERLIAAEKTKKNVRGIITKTHTRRR
jgi:hypothetical protein